MSIALAFIPLNPGAKLSPKAIRADFSERWSRKLEKTEGGKGSTPDILSYEVDGVQVFIALMKAPIPWTDLEGPCQTAWLWPNAIEEVKQHTGHLLVTVMGEDDPVESLKLLVEVNTSILAACPDTSGVYYGNATMVIKSGLYVDMATAMLPDELPIMLLVDLRIGKNENGTTSGFTCGMKQFELMEMETDNAIDEPGELRERLLSLIDYLVTNGPVIKHGQTVGDCADEKIEVRHTQSMFGHEGKVMRLVFPARPRRKRG